MTAKRRAYHPLATVLLSMTPFEKYDINIEPPTSKHQLNSEFSFLKHHVFISLWYNSMKMVDGTFTLRCNVTSEQQSADYIL